MFLGWAVVVTIHTHTHTHTQQEKIGESYSVNGIYDSAGKKTNLKVFQRNDLSTNIDMLIGMLPVSKYWVGNYTSQKDSRGLNEFGLFVGSPDSSNVSFITKDNAQFVDWLE